MRALFAVLAVNANDVVSTDVLAHALWGEQPPPTVDKLVHVYVSQLRKALGVDGRKLLTRPPGYLLELSSDELDRDRFEHLLDEAREARRAGDLAACAELLEQALSLWRGDPLADFVYESWAQPEAARLGELRLAAVEDRAEARLGLGQADELVGELAALVAEHPLRERLRAHLMLALYRAGRQAEALEAYRDARRVLVEDLGIEPGEELQRLEHAILRHDPALDSPEPLPPSLPDVATSLVGRERESAELQELLARSDVRLLTLTGPGGVGKTRLSLEVARAAAGRFPDGVHFVPLAGLARHELVLSAVAEALSVKQVAGEQLAEKVKASIGAGRVLLLIDNLEHLLDAAPQVAELLASAPNLKLLVTSRAALRVSMEVEYGVAPLALPTPGERVPVDRLPDYDALALFVERARRVRPDFRITAESVSEVAEICARLDGLPLAIELAAARLRLLTTTGLLARLDRRLPMLTGGPQDVPLRQQTLRATIDWSYGLLREEDRSVLAALAVFSGGATAESAEAVCASPPGDVLESLTRLLDNNLLRLEGEAEPRFGMLDTIHEYALEQLASSGEEEVRRRHAEHFAVLAEAYEESLRGGDQLPALELFAQEDANLRAALAWAAGVGEPHLGLRLAGAAWRFWWVRGHLVEARRMLERVLALPAPAGAAAARARTLEGAAAIAWGQGDAAAARRFAEEGLELFRQAEDGRGVARLLNHLGLAAQEQHAYDRAQAHFEESGALAREVGNERGIAVALVNLGGLALIQEDFEQAREACEESLELHRRNQSEDGIAISLLNLGFAALGQGRREAARALLEESAGLFRKLGFREYVSYSLEGLAAIAVAAGDAGGAAGLLGEAAELREATGASLGPFEKRLHDGTVGAVSAELGEASLDTAGRRATGAAD